MAREQGKVGENKSETIRQIPAACSDERTAVEFMEHQRWGDSPCCPDCGDTNVYAMKGRDGDRNKDFRWRCRGCGKLYTVRNGTVMEDSRIPLRHWCYAFWRACTSKKGVSALEIKRHTGLSYKSALFLMHRIRFAMAPTDGAPKLSGTIEADETYIGGKPRNKGRKNGNPRGRGTRKQPVMGIVQRGGGVRARVIPNVTGATLKAAIDAHVDKASRLVTDEWPAYRRIGPEFAGGHHVVNHGRGEYVRADVTTNTIESFFALLKRGIIGIYHNVSRKHLQRYLDEAEFRWNHRTLEDGERLVAAIRAADGKRLVYRDPAPT